jgi:hypothetical protein
MHSGTLRIALLMERLTEQTRARGVPRYGGNRKVQSLTCQDRLLCMASAKSFFGTSENAVKSQIWIAVSVSVLVASIERRHNRSRCLYAMLRILSLTRFEETPLGSAIDRCHGPRISRRSQPADSLQLTSGQA